MDPILKQPIESIEKNDLEVQIYPIPINSDNKGNWTEPKYTNVTLKQSSMIFYDVDNFRTNQRNYREPIIGLIHELGHAENYLKGEGVLYNPQNAKDGISPDVELGNKDEFNSIMKENIVRTKLNREERSYDYYKKSENK